MIALHLDVTNQSFAVPDIHLVVTIDDLVVVDADFPVDDQHRIVRHEFTLEPGGHDVTIIASDGHTLERGFDLPAERWATITYWGPSGADGEPLSWRISSERTVGA